MMLLLFVGATGAWAQGPGGEPFNTPTQTVCPGIQPYAVYPGNALNTFLWTITGTAGVDWTIVSGQGTPTININWANTGTLPTTFTVTFTETNASTCVTTVSVAVTVNPLPTAIAGTYGPVCIDGADITLAGLPAGGVWTGTGVSGTGPYVFDPSVGTQVLTYTYSDANGCSDTDQTTITVNPLPTAIAGTYGPVCIDGADITLAGLPAGGVWTGTGVSGTGPYVFDPSVGTQVLTYTYSDANGCSDADQTTITVNPLPTAIAGTYGPVCIDGADITLAGLPAGGVWTGTGVSGTGPYVFDPSVGTQVLTYTYSDANGCSDTDQTTITVNPLPTAIAGTYGPVCIDGADITLAGLPAGGVWTGTGVSGTGPYVFDPSVGTQVLTYTYSDANGCSDADQTTITVNPLPTAIAGTYGPVCIDGADITLAGLPAGGVWTGTGVSGTGPYVFDPSVGTQVLTYTYSDANGCSDTDQTTITVNPLPTAIAGTYGPVCIDGADITLAGLPAGGVWTGTGVSGTGPYVFDPSVGTQVLTYTYSDANGCSDADQTTITVNPLPTAIAGTYGPVCIDGADITLAGLPAGGVWTGTGVSGTGPYVFDPSVGTQVLTYTYSDANGCSDADQTTITVNPLPTAIAGTYGPVCIDGADITLAGLPAGGVWTGTGVSGTGPYVFDPSVGTQVLTYTYSDVNGCSDADQTTIIVNPLPTPSITGVSPVCEGELQSYSTTASGNTFLWTVVGGTFTGQGTNTITVTWTTAPGSVSVLETVGATGCSATDLLNVIVNPVPATSPIWHN